MKLLVTGAAVLLKGLALASPVVAQAAAPVEPPATPVGMRFEIGPLGGLAVAFPEFGVVASVPLDEWRALEVMVSRLAARFDSPEHALAQVQLRIPFRAHLQSRKSFVMGMTRINAQNESEGLLLGGGVGRGGPFLRPHAGVSLQWPLSRHLDVRFDAQGLLLFHRELPMLPRATTAFVWHPTRRGAQRHSN
jgi:hypothetical protein